MLLKDLFPDKIPKFGCGTYLQLDDVSVYIVSYVGCGKVQLLSLDGHCFIGQSIDVCDSINIDKHDVSVMLREYPSYWDRLKVITAEEAGKWLINKGNN